MSEQATTPGVVAGRWLLEPASSTAEFSVSHFGRTVHGTIPLRTADAETGSAGDLRGAHVELDIAAIETGNDRRNRDLAAPRFLNTAEYPTLTVDIPATTAVGNGWQTTAVLLVRGVSVEMGIVIEMADVGADDLARVLVTGTLDRTPIGIKVPRFVIARSISVRVVAVFRRVSD